MAKYYLRRYINEVTLSLPTTKSTTSNYATPQAIYAVPTDATKMDVTINVTHAAWVPVCDLITINDIPFPQVTTSSHVTTLTSNNWVVFNGLTQYNSNAYGYIKSCHMNNGALEEHTSDYIMVYRTNGTVYLCSAANGPGPNPFDVHRRLYVVTGSGVSSITMTFCFH